VPGRLVTLRLGGLEMEHAALRIWTQLAQDEEATVAGDEEATA
jgi:hypothetical protein